MRTTLDQRAVLIVEDDETIGRLLDRALRGNGYQSTWCRTGRSGLLDPPPEPC